MPSFLGKIADKLLRQPELRGFKETDFDSPEAAQVQRRLYASKKIIKYIYQEYCRPIVESAHRAAPGARMVEIGAGTSPLKDYLPTVITTDVVPLPWLDLACSAYALPFADQSLDRLFLMFVCHHLGRIEEFLAEARRCLKPGGEMVILDPAMTPFSKLYYRYCHVDYMDVEAEEWGFDGQGRLSDSNIALAWMVLVRDREKFQRLFPEFEIKKIEYNTCLAFLLSGGLRIRQLLPTIAIKAIFNLENYLIRHVWSGLAVTMALTIKRH